MLHYYASTLLKSFWPGGVLVSSYPIRTEDMKEMCANAAKSLLIDNIPEVMCNLVGAETAKHGALKVFEAVQNATFNKQLFYVSTPIYRYSSKVEICHIDLHTNLHCGSGFIRICFACSDQSDRFLI